MATTSLQLTYSEIRDNIALMLPVNRSTGSWHSDTTSDVSLIMRAGLRKFYYHSNHEWSFLKPLATLTTNAPYETGTITVANGVVTLSGTTFPSWAAGGWLAYGGSYYEVATRDGDTQLTLTDTSSDNDSAAGTTYSLKQWRFSMPSDFELLEGKVYYAADESTTEYMPLERRSFEKLFRLYQDSNTDSWADEPKYYAIYPAPIATTAITGWFLAIWPTPTDELHLKYRYKVTMNDLDSTNQYPPGGAQHSETILEACLSEAELKYNDGPGPHTAKYAELLASSVLTDALAASADTLGIVPANEPVYPLAITNNEYVIHEDYALSDFLTS